MGSYVYSVRTRNTEVEIGGNVETVFALNYLTRGSDFYEDSRYKRLTVGRLEATWRNRELPGFVYLAGDDDRPRDFDRVMEWDGRLLDYDEPRFEGCKRTVGYIRKTKVGRKTVCTVVPCYYSVSIGFKNKLAARGLRVGVSHKETSVTFSGGSGGEHSLDLRVSSQDRLQAHWKGYCENNGVTPKVLDPEQSCFCFHIRESASFFTKAEAEAYVLANTKSWETADIKAVGEEPPPNVFERIAAA